MTTPESHAHLLSQAETSCPALHAMLGRHGPVTLERRSGNLRAFLARCIIGQQLSTKAAQTIIGRVEALAPIDSARFWAQLRAGDDSAMTDSGVSGSKRRAITGLADQLDEAHAASLDRPEAVIEHLTGFWGIGAWTAEMTCMFHYGFADIWPPGDAALRRGIDLLAGANAPAVIDACRPFRSHLALHIWKGLDEGSLESGTTP